MFDFELLSSDSDLELEAVQELKPRKKYEVMIKCCMISENCETIFLQNTIPQMFYFIQPIIPKPLDLIN